MKVKIILILIISILSYHSNGQSFRLKYKKTSNKPWRCPYGQEKKEKGVKVRKLDTIQQKPQKEQITFKSTHEKRKYPKDDIKLKYKLPK